MSMSEELERLGQLHQRGDLSDDEFQRAKASVLRDAERLNLGPAARAVNQFRRSRSDNWLGGVCGGLARLTQVDAWIWRLVFALMVLCAGTGVLAYLLLWLLVPMEEPTAPAAPHRLPA